MKLTDLIAQYCEYRHALGEKFSNSEYYLKKFCKAVGCEKKVNDISREEVKNFLYMNKPITSTWYKRYTALRGFYQYAISRGYARESKLPKILPRKPPAYIPYIYSTEELRCLLKTVLIYQENEVRSIINPYTTQIILLLTYGTGLRISETLALRVTDINLREFILMIRETKFYKSRLVPFSKPLAKKISEYMKWKKAQNQPLESDAHFFVGKNNHPIKQKTLGENFRRIREKSGIKRIDKTSYQPRIHDLRHSFAVHRLISWYQQKSDVQQLLPILSVYMGHTRLADTSVYLTITMDLLNEAGIRFEQYMTGGQHE